MAYALVGTIGAASQGAVTTAVTPAWGTSENRTAGNLLICFCVVTQAATVPANISGWTRTFFSSSGNLCGFAIFYKIAAGADAAPTIAAITNGFIAAQLAEFSGNPATSPEDQSGAASNTGTSPITTTFSNPGSNDVAAGELLIIVSADARSAARTPSDTLTSNHGTITQAGNNNAASSANHYSFGYCLATTSNSGATTATLTSSVTTSLSGLAVCGATFLLAPVLPLPELITQPMTSARGMSM